MTIAHIPPVGEEGGYFLYKEIPLRRSVLDTTLCDKVCQPLVTGRQYSPGTPVSSTNRTNCHDIAEILLKVALNILTHFLHKCIYIYRRASVIDDLFNFKYKTECHIYHFNVRRFLCGCFVDRCLSFCTYSFGHCVICSSSIYRFWLPPFGSS